MPKRAARRSARRPATRTARPSGTSPVESGRRWWNGITKTILTLGALAGAIGAILALWPDPDPGDSARFTAVRVASLVPLSEYKQRSAVMVSQGGERSRGLRRDRGEQAPLAELALAAAQATDTTAPETSSDTTATSSTVTSSTATSSTAASTTATSASSTTGPPATPALGILSSSVQLALPGKLQLPALSAYTHEVLKVIEAKGSSLDRCKDDDDCTVTVLPIIVANSTDAKGNPVPPDVAAQRVVELLKEARTTGGDPAGGQQAGEEPLGVVVTADLELVGLRGSPVLLSWSMWQQGGSKRLYGDWLNRKLAFRLRATTEHDTTSVDLWVPLPKAPGPYFIRVVLTAAGSSLASADSQPFD